MKCTAPYLANCTIRALTSRDFRYNIVTHCHRIDTHVELSAIQFNEQNKRLSPEGRSQDRYENAIIII